jgi:hypothetical protein
MVNYFENFPPSAPSCSLPVTMHPNQSVRKVMLWRKMESVICKTTRVLKKLTSDKTKKKGAHTLFILCLICFSPRIIERYKSFYAVIVH